MSRPWRTQGFMSFSPQPLRGTHEVPPRPMTAAETVQEASPPSSYAVAAMLDGESGAWLRLVGLTMLRGVFILPGLFIASKLASIELGSNELLALSFGGSMTITGGMVAYYAIRRTGAGQ